MTIPNRLPGVVYAQLPVTASRAAALSLPPRLVVIHDTSNSASAQAEASYAASRSLDGATSAHFYVDTAGPLGSLPLNLQAWAAYSYANSHGWHIEMCGYNAGMTGAVPDRTIAITAGLVRQLCDLAAIPMVKLSPAQVAAGARGICGHWDITTGLNVGTHDDPGPLFDWPAFIAAVKGDDMSVDDARTAIAQMFDEAANRSTPTGRNFANDFYKLVQDAGVQGRAEVAAKLDAILAAALDDSNVDVQLPPDAIADLQAIKAAISAVPKAVLDAEAARLQS